MTKLIVFISRWSRQSEELPIHRNLDLNIFVLAALLTDIDSKYPASSLREEIINEHKVDEIRMYYKNNEKKLKPRLVELKSILDQFLSKP